jgi:glycosyltransferase involved in cell wall biosynthesis
VPSASLSVIIATRNRARQLERTLSCLQKQRLQDITLKAIVVDNGSSDDPASVLRKAWPGIDLIPLYEGVAGKSRSLNHALAVADGELLVFTDDDISADQEWLNELTRAATRFPHAWIFCGPIIPAYPEEIPDWIRSHPNAGAFFGTFQPRETEGPLPGTFCHLEQTRRAARSCMRHEIRARSRPLRRKRAFARGRFRIPLPRA